MSDAFENYLSQFTVPTQNWIRQHREWVSNPAKNAKLVEAHFNAKDEHGLEPDSDAYFEHVERRVGIRKDEVVKLTKREAEHADDGTHTWGRHDLAAGRIKDASLIGKPIGSQEFARRKLVMQRDGHYRRD
jgi:hypothetical protein